MKETASPSRSRSRGGPGVQRTVESPRAARARQRKESAKRNDSNSDEEVDTNVKVAMAMKRRSGKRRVVKSKDSSSSSDDEIIITPRTARRRLRNERASSDDSSSDEDEKAVSKSVKQSPRTARRRLRNERASSDDSSSDEDEKAVSKSVKQSPKQANGIAKKNRSPMNKSASCAKSNSVNESAKSKNRDDSPTTRSRNSRVSVLLTKLDVETLSNNRPKKKVAIEGSVNSQISQSRNSGNSNKSIGLNVQNPKKMTSRNNVQRNTSKDNIEEDSDVEENTGSDDSDEKPLSVRLRNKKKKPLTSDKISPKLSKQSPPKTLDDWEKESIVSNNSSLQVVLTDVLASKKSSQNVKIYRNVDKDSISEMEASSKRNTRQSQTKVVSLVESSDDEDNDNDDSVKELSSDDTYDENDSKETLYEQISLLRNELSIFKANYKRMIRSKDNEIEKLRKSVSETQGKGVSHNDETKLLQKKDDEILRLKNDLKWKDEQLLEMNDLVNKNMDLESRISAILDDKEKYEEELKKMNEERDAREQRGKEEKEKKKNEANESPGKKATKRKSTSDENGMKRKLRKRKSGTDEETDTEEKDDGTEEKDDEDIDALFIEGENKDDSDSDIEIISAKIKTKAKPEVEETKNNKAVGKQPKKSPEKAAKSNDAKKSPHSATKSGDSANNNDDGDDDKDDDKDGKGRHNIRKLMTGKKLTEQTKAAAKAEKERLERVKRQQDHHLIEFEDDPNSTIKICTKLVLAMKEGTKTPLVEVLPKLVRKLKPHQVEAVEFMWDNLIESIDKVEKKDPGQGCILAHCMGLGKTLSVITLVHTLLKSKPVGFKTCMVVCPLNTVLNWKYEWKKWLDKKDSVNTYELASCRDYHERVDRLAKWQKSGGVMILGYSLFRILANYNGKKQKFKKVFDESLISPGPDIVVCDEGHILKNDASALSKSMSKIESKRRVVLTGTPLQNNLIEYHCMTNFVKPNLLGTRREFGNRFVNPITNGQHSDSTIRDVKLMKRRAHVLHEMLTGCVQRRDYSALTKFLPPKYEYVISVRLSSLQIELYEKYLQTFRSAETDAARTAGAQFKIQGASLFTDYQALMRVWTHPWVLKMDNERKQLKALLEQDDELDSVDEDALITSDSEEDDASSTTADDDSDASEIQPACKIRKKSKSLKDDAEDEFEQSSKPTRSTRSNAVNSKKSTENGTDTESSTSGEANKTDQKKAKVLGGEVIRPWQSTSRHGKQNELKVDDIAKKDSRWWTNLVEEEQKTKLELSGKLVIMFEILRMAEGMGDKVLLFSQSILTLDLIEEFLKYQDEEAQKWKGKKGNKPCRWVKDEDYFRIDGSTGAQNRSKFTASFNEVKNKKMRLFLISTKAGGLGINLDTANRVIIFDASWNPSHDVQAIFRAYRFGQVKPVYVYRLLAQGTMEEKIYDRQVTKETLSQRVIDEHQIDRHFTANDLKELYVFKPDRLDAEDREEPPTPKVPEDLVLAELLTQQKDWIYGYHEHDSLLENRPEENLSEEEKKAAWDDYEKDKQGIFSYQSYPSRSVPTYSSVGSTYNRPIVGGMAPSQAAMKMQVAQLPRVVQEILKYNPSITAEELQTRLKSFLGMHSRYAAEGMTAPINITVTPGQNGGKQVINLSMPGMSSNTFPGYRPSLTKVDAANLPSRLPTTGLLPGLPRVHSAPAIPPLPSLEQVKTVSKYPE